MSSQDDTALREEFAYVGVPVYLGQECPTCRTTHPCDAICLRHSPRIFYCPCCKVWKKHTPVTRLMRSYQASKLLQGLTST